MQDKTLSRVLVPDLALTSYRPALSSTWELAIAGWAVALWLVVIGALVVSLSAGFQAGIDSAFNNVDILFVGGAATVITATAVARLRRKPAAGALNMLTIGLALFALLGALGVVLGAIGFFVAFWAHGGSTVFYLVVQHLGGIVLGITAIVWALGELANLSRPDPGTPAARVYAKVWGAPARTKRQLASNWEIVVAGWMVASWLYTIAAFTQGAVPDLGAAITVLLLGGPIGVGAITLVARFRPATGPTGAFCRDLALLLGAALGVALVVVGIIDLVKSFGLVGAGTVAGFFLWSVAGIVMGVLTFAWAFGEIAVLRNILPGGTAVVGGAASDFFGTGALSGDPTPPAGTVIGPFAEATYTAPPAPSQPISDAGGTSAVPIVPPPPPPPPPPPGESGSL